MIYLACGDSAGNLTATATEPRDLRGVTIPAHFSEPGLLARAVQRGRVSDVIDGGEQGAILRAAMPVYDPANGQLLGAVQAGMPFQEQAVMLDLIRKMLLALGGVCLVLAAAGGWFLARRAVAPARLAFARQQIFIGDASHELRTPLALLRANAEVLLRHRDRFDEDDASLLDDIVAETEHMSRLSTNLLLLARLDAGKLLLEREVVDLSRIGERLVRRARPLAAAKGILIRDECQAAAVVAGDSEYLEQATLILVENAVKYTLSGGTITLRTVPGGPDVRHASLEVVDTGVGIAPEHVRQLGQRFYRADKSRNRETGGSGIGLAIAFRIAAAHGGMVRIASTLGQGTSATLAIPAARNV